MVNDTKKLNKTEIQKLLLVKSMLIDLQSRKLRNQVEYNNVTILGDQLNEQIIVYGLEKMHPNQTHFCQAALFFWIKMQNQMLFLG